MFQDDQARAAAFLENFDDSVELYETHAAKQKLTLKSKRKYLPSLGLTEEGAESNAGDVGPLVFRPLDSSRLHLMSHASDRETDQAAADDDEPVVIDHAVGYAPCSVQKASIGAHSRG